MLSCATALTLLAVLRALGATVLHCHLGVLGAEAARQRLASRGEPGQADHLAATAALEMRVPLMGLARDAEAPHAKPATL